MSGIGTREKLRRRSDSVRFVRYFRRAEEVTAMPLDDWTTTSQPFLARTGPTHPWTRVRREHVASPKRCRT